MQLNSTCGVDVTRWRGRAELITANTPLHLRSVAGTDFHPKCDPDHETATAAVAFASPMTVSHAAPGTRSVSYSTSFMASRNQSQSSFEMVIGGRNLITSVW